MHRILGNASWLVVERILTMVVNLGVMVVLARSLGPTLFGSLNYLLAIIGLVAPLAALGLNAIITRELASDPSNRDRVLATATAFRFLGAVLGSLVCIAIAITGIGMDSTAEAVALIFLAVASLFSSLQVFDFWFQYKVQSRPVCLMRLVVVLIAALGKVTAVIVAPGLTAVAAVYAVEMAVTGLGYYGLYRWREGRIFHPRAVDWVYGTRLLRQSVWLILSGIAAVVYLKVDQVMLAELASRAEVGTYAVAARLSEVWYFLPNALVISFFPNLLALRQTDTAAYRRRLQVLSDALLMVALLLAVVVTFVARPVVSLVFGSEYIDAAAVLQIHIWAALFVFMRALVSKWLLAEHILVFSFVSHGLGALINVAANGLLIPVWGAKGAALATLFSYAVASHFAMLLHPRTLPIGRVMNASLLLPFTFGARYWRAGSKFW